VNTPLVDAFARWLAATRMSLAIGEVRWITPSVQCVHILAIAMTLGCMAMLNLRLLGVVGRDEALASVSYRYGRWLWPTLLVLFLTGSVLIIGEPRRSLENVVFATKMALVACVSVITFAVTQPLKRDVGFWEEGGRRRVAQLLAVLSLCLWAAIVFAGRWIAYAQDS
jgi:hypothetical protein